MKRDARTILPYHDHNGAAQRPRLLAALAEGRSVALVSDAGTPLVADPGYRLVVEAIAAGHPVLAAPGRLGAARGAGGGGAADRPLPVRGLPAAEGGRPAHGAGGARRRFPRRWCSTSRRAGSRRASRRWRRSSAADAAGGGLPRADQALRGGAARHARGAGRGLRRRRGAEGRDRRRRRPAARRARSARTRSTRRWPRRSRAMSVKDAAAEVAADLGLPRREVYARALELTDAGRADR